MLKGRLPEKGLMNKAGALVRDTFSHIEPFIHEGITTDQLNTMAHQFITVAGGIPAPLNYQPEGYPPFPKSICTSVNEILAHGIPSEYELKDGDVIRVDISLSIDGHFADACRTYVVGEEPHLEKREFAQTVETVYDTILRTVNDEIIANGSITADKIGRITDEIVKRAGIFVAHGLGGHGIGRELHQDPWIPPEIHPMADDTTNLIGSYITIEPIFLDQEVLETTVAPDGWSIVAPRGVLAAQIEETFYVAPFGLVILT